MNTAGVKHIHHAFDFVAPPVGTGRIRFRVLIKHGETNGGSFFWPQAELTMKEGPSLGVCLLLTQTCKALLTNPLPTTHPLTSHPRSFGTAHTTI